MHHVKRVPTTIFALIATLFCSLAGCSERDQTIQVESDDAEMEAAIKKARDSLPQFWKAIEEKKHGESDFCLKVRISDSRGAEHFWVTDIERRDGKTIGTIGNDPDIVASVKLGDRIEIVESDISDWLYMRDGKMVGNETLRPLMKSMPPEEVERIKARLANP